jgi:hypothetical protein
MKSHKINIQYRIRNKDGWGDRVIVKKEGDSFNLDTGMWYPPEEMLDAFNVHGHDRIVVDPVWAKERINLLQNEIDIIMSILEGEDE